MVACLQVFANILLYSPCFGTKTRLELTHLKATLNSTKVLTIYVPDGQVLIVDL